MLRKEIMLGELLVKKGLINSEQLEDALREQRKSGGFLGTTLVKLGKVSEEELYPVLAEQLGVEYTKLKSRYVDPVVIEAVPAKFVSHYKFIPLDLSGSLLTAAVTNPLDVHVLDDLKLHLGYEIRPVLASESDIVDAIRRYYGVGADTLEKIITGTGGKDAIELDANKTENIEDMAQDASIVKFVNQLLLQAVRDRATDIHIEPYEDEMSVRYRVDGILYETAIPPTIKHFQAAITSRIKIMANLNIAERRLPQDGRTDLQIGKSLSLL